MAVEADPEGANYPWEGYQASGYVLWHSTPMHFKILFFGMRACTACTDFDSLLLSAVSAL